MCNRLLVICLVILVSITSMAQTKVDIKAIRTDTRIAISVAHLLEKEPLRKDASDLSSELFQCWYEQAVVGHDWCDTLLLDCERLDHGGRLLVQAVLSSGAFKLEHPEQAKDMAAVWGAGVNGAVTAYVAALAIDPSWRDPFYDKLAEMQSKGTLNEYVLPHARKCMSM